MLLSICLNSFSNIHLYSLLIVVAGLIGNSIKCPWQQQTDSFDRHLTKSVMLAFQTFVFLNVLCKQCSIQKWRLFFLPSAIHQCSQEIEPNRLIKRIYFRLFQLMQNFFKNLNLLATNPCVYSSKISILVVLYFFASEPYLLYFQVESALQELIRCTALARIVYGDGHWKLAETYADLAQGYFELKGNE